MLHSKCGCIKQSPLGYRCRQHLETPERLTKQMLVLMMCENNNTQTYWHLGRKQRRMAAPIGPSSFPLKSAVVMVNSMVTGLLEMESPLNVSVDSSLCHGTGTMLISVVTCSYSGEHSLLACWQECRN